MSCRLFAEHPQLQVEAIEPNEGMRKGFEESQSGWKVSRPVRVQDGSATSLPLPDASFDAVTVAQVLGALQHMQPL